MIIQCENCSRKFIVKDSDIPQAGRKVQCSYCNSSWLQMPIAVKEKTIKKTKTKVQTLQNDESPSVDNIKASDGKTYRFLGSQWAELLPSGKTGLFARKKISQELDEITGRKEKKPARKKQKKLEQVDPSESIDAEKKLNYDRETKGGLGFFGYIFLIIIVGFSVVGILKTFENNLISYFPESEQMFIMLDEQLIYLAESVKNLIVIIEDLINSY